MGDGVHFGGLFEWEAVNLSISNPRALYFVGEVVPDCCSWGFARWTSAVLYLGSRLSQLYKNTSRQSAEGLSMTMFLCAFLGNFAYGTAILMRANSW